MCACNGRLEVTSLFRAKTTLCVVRKAQSAVTGLSPHYTSTSIVLVVPMSVSFLSAAARRAMDTKYCAWARATNTLAIFDADIVAAMEKCEAVQTEVTDERLQCTEVQDGIAAAVADIFNAKKHALCNDALAAIQEAEVVAASSDVWDEVLADARVTGFTAVMGRVPDGVTKRRDVSTLRKFVESRCRSTAIEGIQAHESGKARTAAAKWASEQSERVAAARAEAEYIRQSATQTHCSALAQSDHRPIRVTARLPSSIAASPAALSWAHRLEVRVVSLNVQEHCRDGLSTYVSALPHVRALSKGSGAVGRLVEAMCTPAVIARQTSDLLAFMSEELTERCALAVCLQEVSAELLAAVRAAASAASPSWYVHASAGASAAPVAAGSCVATTCIASMRPFVAEADVIVHGDKGRPRAFAAVTFEATAIEGVVAPPTPTLTLVAVHVRHDAEATPRKAKGDASIQPSNAGHIHRAEEAITSGLRTRLAAGGCVLATGDFNGPPSTAEPHDAAVPPSMLLRVHRAWPEEPTQYGTPLAVDGAVLWTVARDAGEEKQAEASIACVPLEHPSQAE